MSKALVTTVPKTALEVLQRARALIKKPENWTKHSYARTEDGDSVWWTNPNATCFCGLGAIRRASGNRHHLIAGAESLLCESIERCSFSKFNDDPKTEHKDVLLAFDTAIQLAGGPPR